MRKVGPGGCHCVVVVDEEEEDNQDNETLMLMQLVYLVETCKQNMLLA